MVPQAACSPLRDEGRAPQPPTGVRGTRRPRVAASCVSFHWLRRLALALKLRDAWQRRSG